MILSGQAIIVAVQKGEIEIDPFDQNLINPASVDLRLGGEVLEAHPDIDFDVRFDMTNRFKRHDVEVGLPFKLYPGRFYLMHTVERVKTLHYVPVLDGKSSLGRLSVAAHITAGYGDPGFDGQYTLEVRVDVPTTVVIGMRFCQMRFHKIFGGISDYQMHKSNYGGAQRGPVPSRSWRQFDGLTQELKSEQRMVGADRGDISGLAQDNHPLPESVVPFLLDTQEGWEFAAKMFQIQLEVARNLPDYATLLEQELKIVRDPLKRKK